MSSTFFGLTIASSGLSAFQTAVNTTANNIANVQTEGYSRQVANRQASAALRVWQRYGTTGTGVTTTSIKNVRNEYYDVKYWTNQASVGFYETKLNYMHQIEDYFEDDEDIEPGFTTIFSQMFNALNEVSSNAGDENVRKAFISKAQSFCSYFKDVSTGLCDIQNSVNENIKSLVQNINSSAEKIASLTKQINDIEIQGGTANELRDQRALVIDKLSEIVPITVEEAPVTNSNYPDMYTGGTTFLVKLDGQTLVDRFDYKKLECISRTNKVNQTDIDGLYDVVWADTGMNFNTNAVSMNGTLKALFEIRDGNNNENFNGTVTSSTRNSITIRPNTMTSVETMMMNNEGTITLNNKKYNYTSFTAKLNANGEIESYTFELDARMDDTEAKSLIGRKGEIGTAVDFMGIPYYQSQMSEFLREFSERFNAYQKEGQDLNGDPMGAFFVALKYDGTEYDFGEQNVNHDGVTNPNGTVITSTSNSYYQLNALNFRVADASCRDASIFSTTVDMSSNGIDAHDITDEMLKLQNKTKLFRGDTADGFLHCILSDIAVDTQESEIFCQNFTDISSAITTQRLSISGVDEDEEALDLVKFQNAYNMASRMIQCMSEMYDKLINETGV